MDDEVYEKGIAIREEKMLGAGTAGPRWRAARLPPGEFEEAGDALLLGAVGDRGHFPRHRADASRSHAGRPRARPGDTGHVKGRQSTNGVTTAELREVLMHSASYCASRRGRRLRKRVRRVQKLGLE